MTSLFNMFNRCPVLAVPSGLASNGVPTGIQIVGRTFDDVTVYRVGMALEREKGWFKTPDWRPRL
jgi:aspartyl-tRNA(Asn)/glutamyl-tRNA(Gln) amidotransferase subunit A